MADDAKLPQKIVFHLEQSAHYRIFPANGAWGGLTPGGEFMIDFYVERNKPPTKVTHTLNGISVGEEIEREPDKMIVREIQLGILMSRTDAKALAKFINDKVDEFSKAPGAAGKETVG